MGAWGSGTFENDSCCDAIGHIVDDIVRVVEVDLKSLRRPASLERPCLAAVAALSALAKEIPYVRFCLSQDDVRRWKDTFLSWLAQQRSLLGDDYLEWYRNSRREFNVLLRRCAPTTQEQTRASQKNQRKRVKRSR